MTHEELVEKVANALAPELFLFDGAPNVEDFRDDVRREARAAIAIVLEEAARIAERGKGMQCSPMGPLFGAGYATASENIASAIRALGCKPEMTDAASHGKGYV